MFTGIIDSLGKVEDFKNNVLKVFSLNKENYQDVVIGESIAVNGVCLTVESRKKEILGFFVSKETLEKSNLRFLKKGDFVNLERAMKLGDRLSGHIVQGHVEGLGSFLGKYKRGNGYRFEFRLPEELKKFVIPKGSISINGISLTVADISGLKIGVEIIPLTYENTNLKHLRKMDKVNIETDIIGKYIYNWYNMPRR